MGPFLSFVFIYVVVLDHSQPSSRRRICSTKEKLLVHSKMYLLVIIVGGHALLFTYDVLTFQKVYLAFQ